MPKRIQMTRQKPWRADNPDAVIVSRPSKWGNLFRISSTKESRKAPRWWHVSGPRDSWSYFGSERTARSVATDEFRRWLKLPDLLPYDWHWKVIDRHDWMRANLASLRGHDLACWCPLDQPCHGDVLLELANQPGTPSSAPKGAEAWCEHYAPAGNCPACTTPSPETESEIK